MVILKNIQTVHLSDKNKEGMQGQGKSVSLSDTIEGTGVPVKGGENGFGGEWEGLNRSGGLGDDRKHLVVKKVERGVKGHSRARSYQVYTP